MQGGNPRQLNFSPAPALPPTSPNRSTVSTPGQSLSSPVCMEPATSYVGYSISSGGADTAGDAGEAWIPSEPDHGLMAYSSASMPSSMDADLALAIALQVRRCSITNSLIHFDLLQQVRQRRRRRRREPCKPYHHPLSGFTHPIKVPDAFLSIDAKLYKLA